MTFSGLNWGNVEMKARTAETKRMFRLYVVDLASGLIEVLEEDCLARRVRI